MFAFSLSSYIISPDGWLLYLMHNASKRFSPIDCVTSWLSLGGGKLRAGSSSKRWTGCACAALPLLRTMTSVSKKIKQIVLKWDKKKLICFRKKLLISPPKNGKRKFLVNNFFFLQNLTSTKKIDRWVKKKLFLIFKFLMKKKTNMSNFFLDCWCCGR